jgi:hypothetical protein
MIFGGKNDGFMNRYATWEEAEKGHQEAVLYYFDETWAPEMKFDFIINKN